MKPSRCKWLLIVVVLAATILVAGASPASACWGKWWGWGYASYWGYSSYWGCYDSCRSGCYWGPYRSCYTPCSWYVGYSFYPSCWDPCYSGVVVSDPGCDGEPAVVEAAPKTVVAPESPAPAEAAPAAPTPAPPQPGRPPTTNPAPPVAPSIAPPVPGPAAPSSSTKSLSRPDAGQLAISVPSDAKVFVNGYETKSTGSQRRYVSYGLRPGFTYKYEIRAEILRDGQPLEEVRTVYLTAGATQDVAFRFATGASAEKRVAAAW